MPEDLITEIQGIKLNGNARSHIDEGYSFPVRPCVTGKITQFWIWYYQKSISTYTTYGIT